MGVLRRAPYPNAIGSQGYSGAVAHDREARPFCGIACGLALTPVERSVQAVGDLAHPANAGRLPHP